MTEARVRLDSSVVPVVPLRRLKLGAELSDLSKVTCYRLVGSQVEGCLYFPHSVATSHPQLLACVILQAQ